MITIGTTGVLIIMTIGYLGINTMVNGVKKVIKKTSEKFNDEKD